MSSTSNAILTADSIWLDGKIIPWAQGQVPIMTHALHYGLGVFEGLRAYRTHDGRLAVFRLREHMKRFADSCHIIQLQLPYTEEQLCQPAWRCSGCSDSGSRTGPTCGPSPSWATGRWASGR
jgi:branched-chain amino acid aminotransferase